jgi:channel protein (hemolysin III family)
MPFTISPGAVSIGLSIRHLFFCSSPDQSLRLQSRIWGGDGRGRCWWSVALFGVGLVVWMRNLTPGARSLYLILGWLPVLFSNAMFEAATTEMLFWMFAGGVFYSVGTLFLAFDRHVRYFHALWHTFVIAGSICHYNSTLLLVVQ